MKKRSCFLLFSLLLLLLSGCAATQKGIFNAAIWMERSRSDLDDRTVTVDGNPVSYLERSGNGETIVLIHGFTADKNNWIRFVRYLPEPYHVLAIDMPGHGDNVLDPAVDYRPATLARGVEKTLAAIGVERFHLAGNSLGGLVSKLIAAQNPEKVITLGLFDSAGVTSPVPSEFRKLLEKGENPFMVQSREDYDRLHDYAFHDAPFLPWPVDAVQSRKYIIRNDFHQRIFRDLLSSPYFIDPETQLKLLSGLTMPVFVIWGDDDKLLHVSSVEVYRKHLPNVKTVIVKDCGHLPMLERPEESAARYMDFIQNHPDS